MAYFAVPPEEHDKPESYHWVRVGRTPEIWLWSTRAWWTPGAAEPVSEKAHFYYVEPVVPCGHLPPSPTASTGAGA